MEEIKQKKTTKNSSGRQSGKQLVIVEKNKQIWLELNMEFIITNNS